MMFPMSDKKFVRPILITIVLVFSMSTLRTVVLAAGYPETDFGAQYVLTKNGQGVRTVYPVLDGSDVPMPFSRPVEVASRALGFSKLIYAVYPGTSLRDTRYPAFWR